MSGEREGKSLLRKIHFVEWISTRQELSALQLRVAIRLTSLFNVKRGYAWPSLDDLADDLGVTRRAVIKATQRLESLEIFTINRSTGRGHANEYRPRFDRLPDGCAYTHSRAERVNGGTPFEVDDDGAERVNGDAERVNGDDRKSERPFTPSGLTPDLNTSAPLPRRHADARRRDGLKLDWEKPGASLKRIERALKAGGACKEELQRWYDFAIDLMGDHHTGGGISGLACRLCDDIVYALEDGR